MLKHSNAFYYDDVQNEPPVVRWRDCGILVGWVGGVFLFIAFIKYAL